MIIGNLQAVFHEPAYGFGVNAVFLLQHACCERVFGIVWQYLDSLPEL